MDIAVVVTALVVLVVVALGVLAWSVLTIRSLVGANERERQGWAAALNRALDIRVRDKVEHVLGDRR